MGIKGEKTMEKEKNGPKILRMFGIAVVLLLAGFLWAITRPANFEMSGTCNSGFVGVDYKSHFDVAGKEKLIMEPYRTLDDGSIMPVPIPERLDIKNIDGMNCNFHIKGKVPLSGLIFLGG